MCLQQPMNQSQRRYVHYFDQLLKRPVINRLQSLRLCAIELESTEHGLLASINREYTILWSLWRHHTAAMSVIIELRRWKLGAWHTTDDDGNSFLNL